MSIAVEHASTAPAPNPFDSPEAMALPYGPGWNTLPQWYLERQAARSEAYLAGRIARRNYDYNEGGFLTLDGRTMMVYRYHLYELPTDRAYFTPGPLKHLGLYNRVTCSLDTTVDELVIPQTLEGYPWTSAYAIYDANRRAAAGLLV
jgi:hypothetical protein